MEDKLITISTFEHINQASMAKDWLYSAGIESYILDHGISLEAATQLEGQFEMQVFGADVTKALEIIGNMNSKEIPEYNSLKEENYYLKKILVPVDYSTYSLNAACYAAHVAKQKGASITLIHVYFNPVTDPVSSDHFYAFPANIAETMNDVVQNATDLMKGFRQNLDNYLKERKISDISIKAELIGGIAEETILDFASAGEYDMLIVGVRGKGVGENWLGSFMSEIINKSRIPVLAIPGNASFKESIYKRLMYATNFDKSDGKAIQELIRIAKPLETHISVVHIDDQRNNPFINYDLSHFREKYVGDIGNAKMDFDLIISKNLTSGIHDYIIEHQIDIISLTAHKRNMLTSFFKPSVTKELLFRLEIPMLIFHS
jgi:nucleotide-binding universal stress UspA family protein